MFHKHPVLGCLIVQTLWSAKMLQLSSRKADLFFTQWKGGWCTYNNFLELYAGVLAKTIHTPGFSLQWIRHVRSFCLALVRQCNFSATRALPSQPTSFWFLVYKFLYIQKTTVWCSFIIWKSQHSTHYYEIKSRNLWQMHANVVSRPTASGNMHNGVQINYDVAFQFENA